MTALVSPDRGELPVVRNLGFPSVVWADPDPAFLRRGRREPPVLPGEEIFGAWHAWIGDAAEGAGVPPDYVALPLLVAMAALIGNARLVSPWAGWTEPSIIWGGVVGDPSAGKSPGADPVLAAVRDVQRAIGEGFDQDHREWETQVTAAKATKDAWEGRVREAVKAGNEPPGMPAAAAAPQEPERPRIITSDVTPERLGTLLNNNPKGLLSTRDELSGWLLGFDRYSKGGERSFWLEAYGGRPFTIDRVKVGGSVQIERLSISVFGGLQPDRLTSLLLGSDDDGLPARFIWAWPNPLPPSRPRRVASSEFIRSAFSRLSALRPGRDENGDVPILMRLDEKAADEFQDWREAHARDAAAVSGLIESAWGKLPGLLLRLAMTLELSAWATEPVGTLEPAEVSHPSILRAIGLIETYLKPMSERVYGDAAVPLSERYAMTLARWIAHKGVTRINAREVKRSAGLPGLRDMPAVEAAIAILVDANWIRADSDLTGGRPRKDYAVNPKVVALLEKRNGNGQ